MHRPLLGAVVVAVAIYASPLLAGNDIVRSEPETINSETTQPESSFDLLDASSPDPDSQFSDLVLPVIDTGGEPDLSEGSKASDPPSRCFQTIGLGQSRSSSYDSGCLSTHRVFTYAKYYVLTLSSRRTIFVNVKYGYTFSALYVMKGRGARGPLLAKDDVIIGLGVADGTQLTLDLNAGVYTLEVASFFPLVSDRFTLNAVAAFPGGPANVAWTLRDECVDSRGLRVRFFNQSNGRTYPSSLTVYQVPSLGAQVFRLAAPSGARLCWGAEPLPSADYHWGLGINGSCSTCCANCCATVPAAGVLNLDQRLGC
jgi:hypothetical protein